MSITVKHTKVSTVPDSTDTSLVRPSDWNADHTLTGVGTAASLDAGVPNGVATLDSGGQIPLSQIPPLGDLNTGIFSVLMFVSALNSASLS